MKRALFLALFLISAVSPAFAADKIRITSTTPVFAAIAHEITGDEADFYYVASPNWNIHFVSPTPRDVLKVKRAHVFIHGGLDLETWRQPLLDAAGRTDFMGDGAVHAIDVSHGIELKEIPESLSREHGDVHAFGNPHYWMDPVNVEIIAKNITDGLSAMYPERKEIFHSRLEKFNQRLKERLKVWEAELAPYKASGVIVYHNSWPYFLERFGLSEVERLEPLPGIAPTPKHLQKLIDMVKDRRVKVIIKEHYQESGSPKRIAEAAGAEVVTLRQETPNADEGSYFKMMDENVAALAKALEAKKN